METGIITSVYTEKGGVVCDVQGIRVNTNYTKLPVLPNHSATMAVPEQGEKVAMDTLNDGTRFITDIISNGDHYPSNPSEGDYVFQFDGDTYLSFLKNGDDNYDVELSSSGHTDVDNGIPVPFSSVTVDFPSGNNIFHIISLESDEKLVIDRAEIVLDDGSTTTDLTLKVRDMDNSTNLLQTSSVKTGNPIVESNSAVQVAISVDNSATETSYTGSVNVSMRITKV